jgi:hypothetical protein
MFIPSSLGLETNFSSRIPRVANDNPKATWALFITP